MSMDGLLARWIDCREMPVIYHLQTNGKRIAQLTGIGNKGKLCFGDNEVRKLRFPREIFRNNIKRKY